MYLEDTSIGVGAAVDRRGRQPAGGAAEAGACEVAAVPAE